MYKFLRYFSFLSVADIAAIEEADKVREGKPEAQRILAEQLTELVHGKAALEAAQRITASLFSNDLSSLTADDFAQLAQDGLPHFVFESAADSLIDALANGGLAKSKTEARTFIQSGAVSINGNKADSIEHRLADADRLFGRYSLLKRGKKNYALIEWQD